MKNEIQCNGDGTATMKLTLGKHVIIDAADIPLLSQYRWHCNECRIRRQGKTYPSKFYATGGVNGKAVLMHRFLCGDPPGMDVDHEDGDTLNNRRSNLRPCTKSQNGSNRRVRSRSLPLGVHFCKHRNRWRAEVKFDGKRVRKRFDSLEAAVKWRDGKAAELQGEFASLNSSP